MVASPPSLTLDKGRGARELVRAQRYYGRQHVPKKGFDFLAYKENDVRHGLEALFHGKCAYCESRYNVSGPVDIEHFRPKGDVDGVAGHRGYWWMAATWANLLPSCLDCNRKRFQPTPAKLSSLSGVLDSQRRSGFVSIKTGKHSCFPIAGTRISADPGAAHLAAAITAEEALLIDPCVDDPDDHLCFHIDRDDPLGLVFAAPSEEGATGALPALSDDVAEIEKAARSAGVSVRGAVSIQVYGLNRLALVQERTRVLRRLETLGMIVVQVSAAADTLEKLTLAEPGEVPSRDRAVQGLRAVVARTLAEIGAMAAPDAPFSKMAIMWIDRFRDDIKAALEVGVTA